MAAKRKPTVKRKRATTTTTATTTADPVVNELFLQRVLNTSKTINARTLRLRRKQLLDAKQFWDEVFCDSVQTLLREDAENSKFTPAVIVQSASIVADLALDEYEKRWEGVRED